MNVNHPENEQSGALALPADLSMASARELREMLSTALKAPAELTVDASEVSRVSTATLQLLLAFRRARKAAGLSTRWGGISGVLNESAGWLGLRQALELPVEGR
jgi:anti-anti-sigma regulatory factor